MSNLPTEGPAPARPSTTTARTARTARTAPTAPTGAANAARNATASARNLVIVVGCLSRAPEVRPLPSGDVLVAYEVTVAGAGRPSESVPVVWFGAEDDAPAVDAEAGDTVTVVGRVRRRFFRAGGTTQSRTEVVADEITRPRGPARTRIVVERRLRQALAEVGTPPGQTRARRSRAARA